MKTYVLTVSRYFPTTHKRKGERTNFVCKILHAINFDQAGNGLYKICSNECETSCFRRLIDPKIHTIRANYELWAKRLKEVQEGKAILKICYWKFKGGRFIKGNELVEVFQLDKYSGCGVQDIRFAFWDLNKPWILYDDSQSDILDISEIAKNDGLLLDDFKEWFRKYDLSKPMAIIQFTSFRY